MKKTMRFILLIMIMITALSIMVIDGQSLCSKKNEPRDCFGKEQNPLERKFSIKTSDDSL